MKRFLSFLLMITVLSAAFASCGISNGGETPTPTDSPKETEAPLGNTQKPTENTSNNNSSNNDDSPEPPEENDDNEENGGLTEGDGNGNTEGEGDTTPISDILELELNEDQQGYTVVGVKDNSVTSVIIGTYNGLPITCIGESAFSGCTLIVSIVIPDTVTTIKDKAFFGCSKLEQINIPDSIVSIGRDVFKDCLLIKYTEYDNAYYLGNDSNPYLCLLKAKSAEITACNIHGDTKFILSEAFQGCNKLEAVSIPPSITSIGIWAFDGCRSLNGIYITDLASWCKIDFKFNPLSSVKNLYVNGELITHLVIPDGVTHISATAFFQCTALRSITIPSSVMVIEKEAFYNCNNVVTVNLANSVTHIGSSAFRSCTILETIYFDGTKEEWNAIEKGQQWDTSIGEYTISCDDGNIIKQS